MGFSKAFLGAIAAALAVPALAFAQSPVGGGYGGQGGNVQGDVAAGGSAGGGTLPFTGLDLLLMVAAAVLLVGAGMTMRRLARAKA